MAHVGLGPSGFFLGTNGLSQIWTSGNGGGSAATLEDVLLLGDATGAASGIFFSSGDIVKLASNATVEWSESNNPYGTSDTKIEKVASGIIEIGDDNQGARIVGKDDGTEITYSFKRYTNAGMAVEFGGAQISLFQAGSRCLYTNQFGTNFQFGTLNEYRKAVSNFPSTASPASQLTGGVLTNIGATGIVELTLPNFPAVGNYWTIVRVEDFPLRIIHGGGGGFIIPTGQVPDGKYIELGNVGAYVQLISNSNFDYMTVSAGGTITPAP